MNKPTKVLSLLLALLMVFSFSAFAAEALTIIGATYDGADLTNATVPAGGVITVTFSNNVTDASVLSNNIGKIKVKDSAGVAAGATVSAGADKTAFEVTLDSDLAKGSYTLEIGKGVTAKNDTTLSEKAVYPFTVKGSGSGTGGGNKQLQVDSVTANDAPLEGAELKAGDTIVILFTNGMTDHGAESAKLIRVLDAEGTTVDCAVAYPVNKNDDVAKKQFTVTLGELEGGSYTLVLGADIQANNGNTLGEDVKIAFTVAEKEKAPTLLERVRARLESWFAPVRDLVLRVIAFIRLHLSVLRPNAA